MNGKQALNEIRVLVCCALKKGHGPADIAHYVRTKTNRKAGHHFDGNGKKNKEYQAILKKIGRIDKDMKSGRFNDHLNAYEDSMDLKVKKIHASALRSKTVKPQARGRKVTNKDYGIEKQLHKKLVEMWEAQKRVSRSVIFCTVLDIDPTFKVSGDLVVRVQMDTW